MRLGVAGIETHGIAVIGGRLGVLAQSHIGRAAIVVRASVPGIEPDEHAEIDDGVVKLTLGHESVGANIVGLRQVASVRQRKVAIADGKIVFAPGVMRGAARVIGAHRVGRGNILGRIFGVSHHARTETDGVIVTAGGLRLLGIREIALAVGMGGQRRKAQRDEHRPRPANAPHTHRRASPAILTRRLGIA